MVVVVVLPDGVRTWETTGDDSTTMVAVVSQVGTVDVMLTVGVLTRLATLTEETVCPYEVTTGVLEAGAGV
jgi:hypothetical protein